MSAKPQTKQAVKVLRSGMILTRHKSAQQKRQLRDNMDRSMTRLTQLLKSPTSSKSPQKKSPKLSKSPKKNETQPSPTVNRVKRNDKTKKAWLKPKHEMKMIAKANKRKLCTPLRGIKSPSSSPNTSFCITSPVYDELSVEEVIRLIDDTDSLDDEDLIEILTCPSPVWWEDPPNPWYSEQPILKRVETFNSTKFKKKSLNHMKQDDEESNTNEINNYTHAKETTHIVELKHDDHTSSMKNIEMKNICDYKFMAKRKKLESVLGNIKNRIINPIEHPLVSIRNFQQVTNNISDFSKNDATCEKESYQMDKTEKNYSEDDSGSDLSLNDDNMLNDLENMDIPIGNLDKNAKSDDDYRSESDSQDVEKQIEATLIEKSPIIEQSHDQNSDLIPKTLPPLQKFSQIDNVSSPMSTKSDIDSCSTGNDNLDTISDTNVKFLDDASNSTVEENKNEELNETSLIILDKIKKFFQKDRAKHKNNNDDKNKKEFITVYKIVSEEPADINEFEKTPQDITPHTVDAMDRTKINSFYKKRKSTRKKIENSDEDLNKKSLLVPNSENIKYCFKCSSIFETENCLYCNKDDAGASHKECVCEKAQCDEDVNSCVSKNAKKMEHLKSHSARQ